ncbi:MAG: putative DNA binding domain-containing protein [Akkermansia sp.]|nr:putative DNA binding domain-containing protein [Akkermansia sp.]
MSPENESIEWKESWHEQYLKWICGFANAHGGILYIGINDNGQIVGISNAHKLMEDIPNMVRDSLHLIVDIKLKEEAGKEYLEIHVPASFAPVWYRDAIYMRSGSTNQRLHDAALMHFLINKTGEKWDSLSISGVTPQDLDPESFRIFRQAAKRSKRLPIDEAERSNEELLQYLGLIRNNALTRAAVLLFHQNPEQWFMGAWIKIGYFDDKEELLYQDELHGSLISQAERVMELIYTKYLKATVSYENDHRIETYPFSRAVVRESVFNALIHKDYTAGYPIQISISDTKLQVFNPAVLSYDWVSAEAWQKGGSRPLNPALANTFFRAGFAEAWGQGLRKICRNSLAYGMPMPEYSIDSSSVLVKLHPIGYKGEHNIPPSPIINPPYINDTRKLNIIEFLRKKPTAVYADIAQAMLISERTVGNIMRELIQAGAIYRTGTRKKGEWKIQDSAIAPKKQD